MILLTWIANGLLAILYFSVDHLALLSLIASASFLVWKTPGEQRMWGATSNLLAIGAAAFAPSPIPTFLLVITLAGLAAYGLESYNRPALLWNLIRGQALYALAGLGYLLYRSIGPGTASSSDPMMAQGASYINALAGIAMYVIPIGFLVLLVQSVWAHPPDLGKPVEVISRIRSRGKE